MIVIRLEVGPLAANTYLLKDGEGRAGAVIDPGDEGDRIVRRCRQEGLEPRFIINTHGHIDHVGANEALKEAFPEAALCIGAGDAGRLADVLLKDGQELTFGSVTLTVLATPGHTPGGICLLARDEEPPQLFCGDLVFREGVGRTDLPGGNSSELVSSIRQKVLTLPDETVLWPGHDEGTTVGHERLHNPFLNSSAFSQS